MKKALLVIDLQNDYLWEPRKKKFSYDTAPFVARVNALIEQYEPNDVIYIKHIIQNNPINKKLFGFSIQGTKGAELFGGLKIVSDNCFEKLLSDAFSAKKFKAFMKEKAYESVAICGLDEGGCVSATAKGAIKNNLSVEMLTAGIATVFPAQKIEKLRSKLKSMGVKYID
ncbi:MAG: cysteine hydrolase [Oscillospiraceae bacterium]|nr:cysteine hydrolase [Oscillospiraceae bacterium]